MLKQKQSQKLINQIRITLAERKKKRKSRKPRKAVAKESLPLPLQTNLPMRPPPNKSLLEVQLEAERNKNRNDLIGNQLLNINQNISNLRDQQLGQSKRLDSAIKEIKKQSTIQPVKQETTGMELLRPPLSPGSIGVQANEALKDYLKTYKEYIPKQKKYTDEDIDKLQGNQLNKLYTQTKRVIETAQTPAKLRTGQLEPLDSDFDARMRSAQKFLQDRMTEVDEAFRGGGGPVGGGLGGLFGGDDA